MGADTSGVTRVSELLAGREVCVHVGAASAGRGRSKAELEKLVAEYGGSIAQNPGQLQHAVTRCNRKRSGCGSQAVAHQRRVTSGLNVVFTGSQTYCVLADKRSLKVNNIIKTDLYDVVKVDWLLRCVEQKQLLPW